MNLLLDTAVWAASVSDVAALPKRILRLIEDPANRKSILALSVWEVSTLVRRGRIDLRIPFRDWLSLALGPDLEVVPLDAVIAAKEHDLPADFHRDPADRLITAAAWELGRILVTTDARIRDHSPARVIYYRFRQPFR